MHDENYGLGHSEYQIQQKLHYMTMYASASRLKGNSDVEIAKALIQGFAGQLKGWWDFYLSDEAKLHIFNAVKIENNAQVADCVNTLLR